MYSVHKSCAKEQGLLSVVIKDQVTGTTAAKVIAVAVPTF